MSEIIFVRLISGEELVGINVNDAGPGNMFTVQLQKPVQVIVSPPRAANQPPSLGFAPFIPYVEYENDIVSFERQHIVVMAKPIKQLENAYRQAHNMPVGDVRPGLVLPQ